jgi:hypothetical protein
MNITLNWRFNIHMGTFMLICSGKSRHPDSNTCEGRLKMNAWMGILSLLFIVLLLYCFLIHYNVLIVRFRWGMGEAASKLYRSVEFNSMLQNGDFLFLSTFCYPTSLTKLVSLLITKLLVHFCNKRCDGI